MYDILVITGTSGAGKTTIARKLGAAGRGFRLVRAVTTRQRRADDVTGEYDYIGVDEFSVLREQDRLLVDTSYRQELYGIRRSDLEAVRTTGGVPILVLTPESAGDLVGEEPFEDAKFRPLVVFVDADDKTLNTRIEHRSADIQSRDPQQRERDRNFGGSAVCTIRAGSAGAAVDLLSALWQARNRAGVIPKSLIRKFLACGTLLENSDLGHVQGASYDLRLGDEYYHGGRIHKLSDDNPILTLAPYDYAIVTSQEFADLPRDVSGRFDLAVSLFCQGIILSNGPQVDAGFRGPLFCLLFNTSSGSILLKRRQHYATIEFHKLLWPTEPYGGHYQAKTLIDYLPSNAALGAINELKQDLEEVRKETKTLQANMWAVLTLILAMIAVFVAFR